TLFTTTHTLHDRMVKRLANHGAVVKPALRHRRAISRGSAQIDHLDARQFSTTNPIRECNQGVLPRLGVGPALQRRRRTAKNGDRAFGFGANDRHLTRVITGSLALLVARFMFFIDDDRTEILERSEYRGARADHDA